MKTIVNIFAAFCLTLSAASFASDDRQYDHFPGLKAPTMAIALCNISRYNELLAQIIQKDEISVADMTNVHELTYTLENAIGKLSEDLLEAKVDLEQVHLASETLQVAIIKRHADLYLAITDAFSDNDACKVNSNE
jgi:hypothetical protein